MYRLMIDECDSDITGYLFGSAYFCIRRHDAQKHLTEVVREFHDLPGLTVTIE